MQPPEHMTTMMNAVHSDPSSSLFVRLGFEVAAAHRFVFQEMMSGTKNLLQLDDNCIEQLVTVARKPDRGVASIPVAELDK